MAPRYVLGKGTWDFLRAHKEKHQCRGNNYGYSMVEGHDVARTLSSRYHKDGSEILVTRPAARPRRLTPRECARLMGFDHPGHQAFQIPVSDTSAYRQFGNAVVPQVVTALAAALH